MIQVSGLFIYPIKSCGGIGLTETEVVPGGLRHDRRYMIVDASGRFVTRREEARLAQVVVNSRGEDFHVFAPGAGDFALPAEPSEELLGELRNCTVWRDTVEAKTLPNGSSWFSAFLGRDVELVYMPDPALRQVNPARSDPGDQVSFADGYPLLLTSEQSLVDLNARLDQPIPMSRFRPNVVMKDADAFAEDTWKTITIGSTKCTVPKLCDRCVVTTIEEGSSGKGKEPLKTLASYRRWDGAVWFGATVIPKNTGRLRVGDVIQVVETGPHPAG
ncbi:MAG: MOSC domain-containing protein [Rhodospirillales bacterium]|nr:MOSC domain-containing protein [Rhodospirillales bacterium]